MSYLKLIKIKPYLKDIAIDLKSSNTWKIQLTISVNFISSKDTEEKLHAFHAVLSKRQYKIYNL